MLVRLGMIHPPLALFALPFERIGKFDHLLNMWLMTAQEVPDAQVCNWHASIDKDIVQRRMLLVK